MLSILIPTYDYVCYSLVAALQEQAEALGEDYEILVMEDGGHDQVKAIANHKINELPYCRYIRRQENIGRSAIRNFLAHEAQGDRLLLIDCDAQVERSDFLARYLCETAPVVVGGLYHAPECADPHRSLRHRYERKADAHRGADDRNAHPYAEFSTFNVMLHRSVVERLQFDPDCREYGYEDALFGVELQRRGIAVLHIDNPLLHTGIDTNEEFLRKTEAALRTLWGLKGKMQGHSHLENLYQRLASWHLQRVLRLLYGMAGKPLRSYLQHSAQPSLRLFALYKLLYFSSLDPS